MSRFRNIALTAILAAVTPFAASAAGSGGGPNGGVHMYSTSPLITHTSAVRQAAAAPHNRGQNSASQKPVRVASLNFADASIYQPGPLITTTRQQRLVAEINQAYGTKFPIHSENQAVAMNNH